MAFWQYQLFFDIAIVICVVNLFWFGKSYAVQEEYMKAGICKFSDDDLTLYGFGYGECIKECRSRSQCVSINFYSRVKQCRLNFETDLRESPCPLYTYSAKAHWVQKMEPGCDTINCEIRQKCMIRDSMPICVYTDCERISNIANGIVLGNHVELGKRVAFRCNKGFNMKGSSSLQCQSDGTWSNNVPTCLADTPKGLISKDENPTSLPMTRVSTDYATATTRALKSTNENPTSLPMTQVSTDYASTKDLKSTNDNPTGLPMTRVSTDYATTKDLKSTNENPTSQAVTETIIDNESTTIKRTSEALSVTATENASIQGKYQTSMQPYTSTSAHETTIGQSTVSNDNPLNIGIQPTLTYGIDCENDADCRQFELQCRNGKCFCVFPLVWNAMMGDCVNECNTYGDTYQEHTDVSAFAATEKLKVDVADKEDCAEHCQDELTCIAFLVDAAAKAENSEAMLRCVLYGPDLLDSFMKRATVYSDIYLRDCN